jgi:hypothetical protein
MELLYVRHSSFFISIGYQQLACGSSGLVVSLSLTSGSFAAWNEQDVLYSTVITIQMYVHTVLFLTCPIIILYCIGIELRGIGLPKSQLKD